MVTTQYVFPSDISGIILAKFKEGATLYFHSHAFMLGPTYQVSQGQVPGVIQINLGFDSLKSILIIFIPLDYQTYSWCRRQYRLSMNIIKFQAKIGMDYYPSLPSLSNGGNIAPLSNTVSSNFNWARPNNEYLINLLQCFGQYNDIASDTFMNNVNFAVNNRPYAPDNFKTQTGNDSLGFTYQQCFNQYGWPSVHENRCVGKAIYALDFETLNKDMAVLSGINTTAVKPFELYFEVQSDGPSNALASPVFGIPNSGNQFPRNAMAYPFLWYDFVVAVNTAGPTVVGRS
jgi:hypothetical protein